MYTFSNYTKQLKSRISVQYELTTLRWGHSQTHVGGGGTRHVRGGARHVRGGGVADTYISTKSFELEEGGEAVWWRLELPTSWCEGGGAVRLKGEANLP
jgi:hypothetical protein